MARPFLKWAGGKAKLAPIIAARLPASFGRYHEPFLGGGGVFFALSSQRNVAGAFLNDANRELIEAFTVVRDSVEELIISLDALAVPYLAADAGQRAELYYRTRASEPATAVARAARFIFLNRTGYNGLYRVNRQGRFNVPHGRYLRPSIVNAPALRDAAAALSGVELRALDFEEACAIAQPGDLVYLDPPYHPLSETSKFTAYTAAAFDWADQVRLAAVFSALTSRGVYALLSNSAHAAIADLYRGFDCEKVPMSRAINSNPARRTAIAELLVSNVREVQRRHG